MTLRNFACLWTPLCLFLNQKFTIYIHNLYIYIHNSQFEMFAYYIALELVFVFGFGAKPRAAAAVAGKQNKGCHLHKTKHNVWSKAIERKKKEKKWDCSTWKQFLHRPPLTLLQSMKTVFTPTTSNIFKWDMWLWIRIYTCLNILKFIFLNQSQNQKPKQKDLVFWKMYMLCIVVAIAITFTFTYSFLYLV